MKIKTWNIEAITGYKPITTFYEDFSIADRFGAAAVKDTFNRALKGWKHNYKYLTELAMAMSWKVNEHYCTGNMRFAELYQELYEKIDTYCKDNLKGEELRYYYLTTD